MTTKLDNSPLVKTRVLRCTAQHAFSVYVDKISEWWPLDGFSVFGSDATVAIEQQVGGHIVETGPTGEQSVWGTLTRWEPHDRIAHSWHPGQDQTSATQVEVTFTPTGGGCEVRLVHSGWDGDGIVSDRANYDDGWDIVLDQYTRCVDTSS